MRDLKTNKTIIRMHNLNPMEKYIYIYILHTNTKILTFSKSGKHSRFSNLVSSLLSTIKLIIPTPSLFSSFFIPDADKSNTCFSVIDKRSHCRKK